MYQKPELGVKFLKKKNEDENYFFSKCHNRVVGTTMNFKIRPFG